MAMAASGVVVALDCSEGVVLGEAMPAATPGLTPFLRDAKRSEALVYGRASFIGISITADSRSKQIAAARMTTTILSVI